MFENHELNPKTLNDWWLRWSRKEKHLFNGINDFAGKMRDVNIAIGGIRFAPIMYLGAVLKNIDRIWWGLYENRKNNMWYSKCFFNPWR